MFFEKTRAEWFKAKRFSVAEEDKRYWFTLLVCFDLWVLFFP